MATVSWGRLLGFAVLCGSGLLFGFFSPASLQAAPPSKSDENAKPSAARQAASPGKRDPAPTKHAAGKPRKTDHSPAGDEHKAPKNASGEAPPPRAAAGRAMRLQVQAAPAARARLAAAVAVQVGGNSRTTLNDAAMFRIERQAMQWLRSARTLLAEKRFSEATRFLGRILEAEQDYFYQPDKSKEVYRSLKSEAQRLIGQMPAPGRQSYELQYGAVAARMLDDAVTAGDLGAVAEVARRFFHTAAGYEATYLLGNDYLRHDRPMAAALCFERLRDSRAGASAYEPALSVQLAVCWLRSGMDQRADDVLVALHATRPRAVVRVAGKEVPLFDKDADALAWLRRLVGDHALPDQSVASEWTMFGGGPARNRLSKGSSPLLEKHWRVPVTTDPAVEKWLDQISRAYVERQAISIPALSPLVVDNTVLMRTTRNLLAVDFRTGKRLWEVPVEFGADGWASGQGLPPGNLNASIMVAGLDQRMWRDATFGTLSSDGQFVFSIEDLAAGIVPQKRPRTVFLANGTRQLTPSGPLQYNRLAAFEIRTGKLKWELGGPQGSGELAQAGTFFLGAPLPLDGRLYGLGDQNGEIRLLAIESKTGRVDWSQQLVVVERTILQDNYRRRAGSMPSYADGVIVCPTASGAVVAVDLTTRSLLWGYRYAMSPSHNAAMIGRLGGVFYNQRRSPGNLDYWIDSTAILAEGNVILTPAESDEIHCLNLADGTLVWKKPRLDSLYVAGVVDGVVYLVGRSQLRALRLSDGEPVWDGESRPLPGGSLPSGHGYLAGGKYYLPLTSAEVATIDLSSGRVVAVSKSRQGEVPGNLVCYDGAVVSQAADGVDLFYQLAALKHEVERRLADNPQDAPALALRAEIRLHEGQLTEAIDDLRRSYQQRLDPRTRQLLVESLLEAVKTDFTTHAEAAEELASLIEKPGERAAYYRTIADALAKSGRRIEAFDRYMQLLDPTLDVAALERIDGNLEVRRDCWLRSRLARLQSGASADEQQEIDQKIVQRLEDARQSESLDDLRTFIRVFGSHRLADAARWQLADRLANSGNLLEAELLLRRLEQQGEPAISRSATARMASLLLKAGRTADATPYYARLAGELASQVCLDGKTGSELFEQLPPDSPIRRRLGRVTQWPVGQVEKNVTHRTTAVYRYFNCALDGPRSPFFDHQKVEFDQGRSTLIGRDDLGRERWRVPLFSSIQQRRMAINAGVLHGAVAGHLLVVSAGPDLFAIDTLGMGGQPRVLWKSQSKSSLPGMPVNRAVHAGQIALPWGGRRTTISDAYGRQTGMLGPVTSDYVCFQQDRDLKAVDPTTGQTLWVRHDIPPGSTVWGDGEFLFVSPPGSTKAEVFNPDDAALLGRREVPPANMRMATIGRNVLVWENARQQGGRAGIRFLDPWDGQTRWRLEIDARAKARVVEAKRLAIVEPKGRFRLIDLDDGSALIDQPIDAEPQLHEIYVLPSPEVYILVTNRPWRNNRNNVYVNPVPGGQNNPLIDGRVYGFDRATGQQRWMIEVNRQGLMLDQPAALPVLVFAARVYEKKAVAQPRGNTYYPVLIIDKRNGRTVHEESVTKHISGFDLSGDLESHRVVIKHIQSTIELTMTDQPVSPPVPDAATVPEEGEQSSEDQPQGEKGKDRPTPDTRVKDVPAP